MSEEKHSFGGDWTYKKLEIIGKYLSFYSNALSNQPFNLHYIDPFSGTGTIDFDNSLLNSEPIEGSVAKALKVKKPFFKYHFNEPNKGRREQLQKFVSTFEDRNVSVTSLDANTMIENVCDELSRNDRAVFFIDPYGCQLDWQSLVRISRGIGNDVWIWFPVSAVMRQASKDRAKIQQSWRERLNRLFGENDWESALYETAEEEGKGSTLSLFGDEVPLSSSRESGTKALDKYVMSRLKEIFSYVNEKPMAFTNQRGSTLFRLYFAMSNERKPAIALARKGVSSILK